MAVLKAASLACKQGVGCRNSCWNMQRAGNVSQLGSKAGQAPSKEQEKDGSTGAQGCCWDRGDLAAPAVLECGSAGIPAVQLCPWPCQDQQGMPRAQQGMPRLRWDCPGLRWEFGSSGTPALQPCPWPARRRGACGTGSLPAAGSCKQGSNLPVPTHSATAHRVPRPLKLLGNSSSLLLKEFGFLLP